MPELPEARTIARRLHAAIAGCEVAAVRLCRRDMLKSGSPRSLRRFVAQRWDRVDTRGKYVVLHARPGRLVVQLGMSGRLVLTESRQPIQPHTHLIITLSDGRDLRSVNPRRIAAGVHVLPPGSDDLGPLAVLGPEATDIPPAEFISALRSRRRAIKSALLDSSLLAGVGNIYSDEALARAGIRPTRRCDRISPSRLRALHASLVEVLTEAIAAGGSSLADANPFVDADGREGYFAVHHRVYGRGGQPCTACGEVLRRMVLGGRSSTFCPRCQR